VELTVSNDHGVLRAQITNQPAFRIHASSESEFFFRVVEATLTFAFDFL
jgi:hypothetical protein